MPQVQLLNTTAYTRSEVVHLGIPFDAGELQETDTLVVEGATTSPQKVQWYPMGARWPDNSVRYARAAFVADVTANSQPVATVTRNRSYTPTTYAGGVSSNLNGANIGIHLPDYTNVGYGGWYQLDLNDPSKNSVLEGGGSEDCYTRYRHFSRVAGREHLWVELVYEIYSNSQRVLYWLWFGNSYIQRGMGSTLGPWPQVSFDIGRVWFGIGGVNNHVYMDDVVTNYKWMDTNTTANGTSRWTTYGLLDPACTNGTQGRFRLGTSRCVKGSLYFGAPTDNQYIAEKLSPVSAIATNWNGRCPPYYTYTPVPAANPGGATVAALRTTLSDTTTPSDLSRRVTPRDPYSRIVFSQKNDTGGTGGEWYSDHSLPWLMGIIASWPVELPILEASSRTLSYRSMWLREPDGTWFKASNYPNARSWGFDPWLVVNIPQERMGYAVAYEGAHGLFDNTYPPQAVDLGANVTPFDREHFQGYNEVICALLTGDWFAVSASAAMAERWISEMGVGSGNGTLDGVNSARAVGRTLRMGVILYEITGNSSLLTAIHTRISLIDTVFRELCPGANGSDYSVMKWLCPKGPVVGGSGDVRAADLPNTENVEPQRFYPWQEAVAAIGILAAGKLIERQEPTHAHVAICKEIARKLAAGQLLYGTLDLRGTSSWNSISRNIRFLIMPTDNVNAYFSGNTRVINSNLWAWGDMVVGLTSGVNGTIYFHEVDDTVRPTLRVRACTGDFADGEVLFNLRTSAQWTISYQYYGFICGQTVTTNYEETGFGTPITETQLTTALYANQQAIGATPRIDSLRYAKWYTAYTDWESPVVSIVIDACKENFYGATWNSTLQTLAYDMLAWLKTQQHIDGPGSAMANSLDNFFYPFYNVIDNTLDVTPTSTNVDIRPGVVTTHGTIPSVTATGVSTVSIVVNNLSPVSGRGTVRSVIVTINNTSINQTHSAYPIVQRATVKTPTVTATTVGTPTTVSITTPVAGHTVVNAPAVFVLNVTNDSRSSVTISMSLTCGLGSNPIAVAVIPD